MGGNYGYESSSYNPLVIIFCLVVFGLIGYRLIKVFLEFSYNNSKEVFKRQAKIIGKRMKVYGENGTETEYYVTFEFEDGERLELKVKDKVYGLITNGDEGILEYQGRRFWNFERG